VKIFSTYRKTFRHSAIVAMFAMCMVAAQFSALQHSINHPFHAHTHLCDSFVSFQHCSSSLTHHIPPLLVAQEKISSSYAAETQAAFHGLSSTFRIRGPPVSLV
jgi:hypothetical protein